MILSQDVLRSRSDKGPTHGPPSTTVPLFTRTGGVVLRFAPSLLNEACAILSTKLVTYLRVSRESGTKHYCACRPNDSTDA